MAVDTGTSTKQLIAGMYMIESAGYHGKAGLDVLKAAAEGAKVGNADLGTVADATTTVLKDYGATGLTAAQAVNELVATTASGKTHMQDLAGSLSQILPTASAAGVGLNDVMGAMATMTGEGVPAANAATYLRQTILALDAPGKQAQKALASIGLSSKDVAAEMHKSLPDALKMITDRLAKAYGEGSPAYVKALKDITGGSRQMQGVLDLTGGHMKDFQSNVESVGGAVKKSGDKIQGWSTVQQTFNFKMDKAKEVVETLGIKIGTKLLPFVGTLVSDFTGALPGAISFVTGTFNGLIGAGQGVIDFLQGTGPASTAAKVALVVVGGAMAGLAAAQIPAMVSGLAEMVTGWGADVAITATAAATTIAASLPFIAIGAAIAPVIAIVMLAVTHWKQITTALGHFKDMLASVLGAIGGLIGGGIGKLGDAVNALGGVFKNIFGGLGGIVKGGINVLIGGINDFINALDSIQIHIPSVGVGPVHTPSFDWNGLGIPDIPQLAVGGEILQAGLAIVGVSGPEMVKLPSGAHVYTPAQSQTIQNAALAGAGAAGGNDRPIILEVDGRRLARVLLPPMVNAIRTATGIGACSTRFAHVGGRASRTSVSVTVIARASRTWAGGDGDLHRRGSHSTRFAHVGGSVTFRRTGEGVMHALRARGREE